MGGLCVWLQAALQREPFLNKDMASSSSGTQAAATGGAPMEGLELLSAQVTGAV